MKNFRIALVEMEPISNILCLLIFSIDVYCVVYILNILTTNVNACNNLLHQACGASF